MDKKAIEERLNKLETMIEALIKQDVQKPQKSITQQDFKTFYNRVQTEFQKDDITPCCIWMNEQFANDLKHNVLYPNYETGYWYVIGEPEIIPVGFSKMKYDFYIDCAVFGDFINSTPENIRIEKGNKTNE